MKKKLFFLLSVIICKLAIANNEELHITQATTLQAVVFRTGAELTQKTTATLKTGLQEIVINGVANGIDNNSIQIQVNKFVTLVGFEIGSSYLIKQDKSNRQKMLEDSISKLILEIERLNIQIQSNNDLLDALKANKDIKGSQLGLNVAELSKFLDFYKTKSQTTLQENSELNQRMNKLKQAKDVLYLQVNEEQALNNNKAGVLKIQVQVAVAGKYDFTISYLTNNAYWTPYYDLQVKNTKSPLSITTKAKIVQTTGIEWKNIKLSLSTATPTQWGNAPILSSWFIAYIDPIQYIKKQLLKDKRDDLDIALQGSAAGVQIQSASGQPGSTYDFKLRGSGSIKNNSAPLFIVNGMPMEEFDYKNINANAIKSIEVLKDASATAIYGSRGNNGVVLVTLKEGLEDYISTTQNTLDTQYEIETAYTIPSNGKAQIATLATTEAPCNYSYIGIPKLDKAIYFVANISNWQKLNLLPGEANVIVEGTYIGKTFIDPSSVVDTLTVTLGREKRISVTRNKINDFSSVKFLGTNKQQEFTYDIVVKNNKQEAAEIEIKDQFPLTTNKDIEIVSTNANDAVVNSITGEISWKIKLAAGESKKLSFSFELKYPKDKKLNSQ